LLLLLLLLLAHNLMLQKRRLGIQVVELSQVLLIGRHLRHEVRLGILKLVWRSLEPRHVLLHPQRRHEQVRIVCRHT
jgi:hypothetical protein